MYLFSVQFLEDSATVAPGGLDSVRFVIANGVSDFDEFKS